MTDEQWCLLNNISYDDPTMTGPKQDGIEQKLAKKLEDLFVEAAMGGAPRKPRQTALRVRGRTFETVELDDAGKIIEPVRCTCGGMIVMHRPQCPFYCLTT
jgi:hypothetical protein